MAASARRRLPMINACSYSIFSPSCLEAALRGGSPYILGSDLVRERRPTRTGKEESGRFGGPSAFRVPRRGGSGRCVYRRQPLAGASGSRVHSQPRCHKNCTAEKRESITLFGKSASEHAPFAQHVAGSETWTLTHGHGRDVQEWKLKPSRPDTPRPLTSPNAHPCAKVADVEQSRQPEGRFRAVPAV
jgi:hypothetical protein